MVVLNGYAVGEAALVVIGSLDKTVKPVSTPEAA